jgi:hypothetical protein
VADIFTKIVSAQRLDWHMTHFRGEGVKKNDHGSVVRVKAELHDDNCEKAGLREVGKPSVVTACPCIKHRLLGMFLMSLAGRSAAQDENYHFENEHFEYSLIVMVFIVGIALGAAAAVAAMSRPSSAAEVSQGCAASVATQTGGEDSAQLCTSGSPQDTLSLRSRERRQPYVVHDHEVPWIMVMRRTDNAAHFCPKILRAWGGDRRRPCRACASGPIWPGDHLFVTTNGECFHRSQDCVGLRNSQSDVRTLSACRCCED